MRKIYSQTISGHFADIDRSNRIVGRIDRSNRIVGRIITSVKKKIAHLKNFSHEENVYFEIQTCNFQLKYICEKKKKNPTFKKYQP